MITHHNGNLFESDADILCHGVNARGIMGAGIALQFAQRYPAMNATYQNLCNQMNPRRLVGHASIWANKQYPFTGPAYISNIFSQLEPGPDAKLEYLVRGLNETVIFAYQQNIGKIGMPCIGAGIGGLDWSKTEATLQEFFEHLSVELEIWTYQSS